MKRIEAAEEGRDSEDIISSLPDAVLTTILSGLPLKQAVRTSVLSTRWRHLWNSIPILQLNESLIIPRREEQNSRFNSIPHLQIDGDLDEDFEEHLIYSQVGTQHQRWLAIVYLVLFLHKGPVKSCLVSFPFLDRYSLHIDNFFLFLSKLGVEVLFLLNLDNEEEEEDPYWSEIENEDPYCVPTNLFFFTSLQRLLLKGCRLLEIPFHFHRFVHLKVLYLWHFTSTNDTIEQLISSSPVLEILLLYHCKGVTQVRIHGPNLKRLYSITSRPLHILFRDTVNLEKAILRFMNFRFDGNDSQEDRNEATRLVSLLKDMAGELNTLKITWCRRFAKCLAKGNFLDCLPERYQFNNLKKLVLEFDFIDEKVLPFLSFLLSHCPHLKKLKLEINGEFRPMGAHSFHDYWDKEGPFECVTGSLEVVKMKYVESACEYETGFARYLLMNAGLLKNMCIKVNAIEGKHPIFSKEKELKQPRILKELNSLQRASPHAQLTFTLRKR